MILEYLQSDPNPWDAAAVPVRALYYLASLGGAGLALFALGFGGRLTAQELQRLRRLVVAAVLVGGLTSLAGLFVRAGQLTLDGQWLDATVWASILESRIGDAFALRMLGLVMLLALLRPGRGPRLVAALGALAIAASYAAMGHSTLFRPREILAVLVVVHLLGVAFWIGSLLPLSWIARRGDSTAVRLIEDWSRTAIAVVAGLAVAGALLGWYLVGRLDLLLAAWYGWALLAKLAVVFAMLGFAAWHRWRALPALHAGGGAAAGRLAASIRAEAVVACIVLYAVAEMVSVHPIDYGHRIQASTPAAVPAAPTPTPVPDTSDRR